MLSTDDISKKVYSRTERSNCNDTVLILDKHLQWSAIYEQPAKEDFLLLFFYFVFKGVWGLPSMELWGLELAIQKVYKLGKRILNEGNSYSEWKNDHGFFDISTIFLFLNVFVEQKSSKCLEQQFMGTFQTVANYRVINYSKLEIGESGEPFDYHPGKRYIPFRYSSVKITKKFLCRTCKCFSVLNWIESTTVQILIHLWSHWLCFYCWCSLKLLHLLYLFNNISPLSGQEYIR